MPKFTTLISSSSSKVPLLESFQRLGKAHSLDVRIMAGDSDKHCLTSFLPFNFWHMPKMTLENIEKISDEMVSRGIHLVIPTRDGELQILSSKKDLFASKGIDLGVSDLTVIENCLDKLVFYQQYSKVLPLVDTANDIAAFNDSLERFVVKERFGSGSISLAVNVSAEEAISHSKNLAHPIFQPFVEGTEYSIDTYTSKKKEVIGVIVRRRDLVINGESQVATAIPHRRLEEFGKKVASLIGFNGHANIQVIDDGLSTKIIECNARIGGGSTLSFHCGLLSPVWSIVESMGGELADFPFEPLDREVRMIRHKWDTYIDIGT